MTVSKVLRTISIIGYFSIFLSGEVIGGPMIVLMYFALLNTDLTTQIFIVLAFISLITLIIMAISKKSKLTLLIEGIIFIFLLLPIIGELIYDTSRQLHYLMFIVPALFFILCYPLSLYFSYKEYRSNVATKQIDTTVSSNS